MTEEEIFDEVIRMLEIIKYNSDSPAETKAAVEYARKVIDDHLELL